MSGARRGGEQKVDGEVGQEGGKRIRERGRSGDGRDGGTARSEAAKAEATNAEVLADDAEITDVEANTDGDDSHLKR